MDHYIYFRQLSDEDKLNMKNDLERFGWKIAGEASMAHSPNHIPSESKVSFYILSCPNNKEVQFPEGYFLQIMRSALFVVYQFRLLIRKPISPCPFKSSSH